MLIRKYWKSCSRANYCSSNFSSRPIFDNSLVLSEICCSSGSFAEAAMCFVVDVTEITRTISTGKSALSRTALL